MGTGQHPKALVLFSGGRDSSLATCLMANQGFDLVLVTCFNGASVKGEVSEYRLQELRKAFPERITGRHELWTVGLFRKVAIESIERDFAKYGKNLLLLGSQMATHTEGLRFCIENGITLMANGFSGYQANYPEQMPEAIEIFRDFTSSYGVGLTLPVYEYKSPDAVKYALLEFGISTKSLEGLSIFSDSCSQPSPAQVTEYMSERLNLCKEYLARRTRRPPQEP